MRFRGTQVDAAAAGVIVVVCVIHGLVVGRSGFFLDDFRNLADARRHGLSLDLLTTPLFEHFSPGHRVMDWLAAEPLRRDFRLAAGLETACLAVSLAAFAGLLRESVGLRPGHLLPVALLGLSWTLIATDQWFAGGAHVAPALALMLVSGLLAARHARTAGALPAAFSLLAAAAAVLCWVQAVMTPLLVVLTVVLLADGAERPAAVLRSLRRRWVLFGAHILLMALFCAWLATRPWRPQLGTPAFGDVVSMARVVLARGLFPPLIGLGLPGEALDAGERVWQALALAAPAALLAFSILTRRRWGAGLAILFGGYLAKVAMIATGRLAASGPSIGNEPRYVAMLVPFALLGAIAALQRTARTRALPATAGVRPALAVSGVALLAVVGANLHRTAERHDFARIQGDAGASAGRALGRALRPYVAEVPSRLVDVELAPPFFYAGTLTDDNTLGRLGSFFHPGLNPIGAGPRGSLLRVEGTAVVSRRFAATGPPVRVRCVPGPPCAVRVRSLSPQPAGSFVRVEAPGPVLRRAEVAPLDGRAYKTDPRQRATTGIAVDALTAPVWASEVSAASARISVSRATTVVVAHGVLLP